MTTARLAICSAVSGLLWACTGPDTSAIGDRGTSPGSQSVDSAVASTGAEVVRQGADVADAPSRAVPDWLAVAVDHGVTPLAGGGTSYQVDPFVAALVLEQARTGELAVTRLSGPGGVAGYRLDQVDPNGLLHRLGLSTGDVVHAFNGTTVEDPAALLPALAGSHNRLVVQLERGDYAMTLEYRLVGGMAWSRALGSPSRDPSVEPDPGPAKVDDPGAANIVREPPQGEPSSAPLDPSAKPTVRPAAKPVGNGAPSGAVRCPSTTQCEIDRATFDGLVSNPARLEAQATIVPAISNDVQSGYKLKTVKPGTDLSALGFRGGDKITHINGHFLGDDSQATALYLKLPATRVFNIRFERNGKQLAKRVQVR